MKSQDYVKLFHEVHNNKYQYMVPNDVELVSQDKISIVCPEHGEFTQILSNHKRGAGCKECGKILKGKNKRIKFEHFLAQANEIHNHKYDYSKTKFTYNSDKIIVICPEHGEFNIGVAIHYTKRGQGCPKCSYDERSKQRRSSIEYIESKIPDIIKQYYTYDLTQYVNSRSYIPVNCLTHQTSYTQLVNSFIKGSIGCNKCNTTSMGELKIAKWLQEKNIPYIGQHSFPDCKNIRLLKFDFYLPDHNVCIEFDGKQHYVESTRNTKHEPLKVKQKRDSIKNEYCLNNGIGLIRIPFWEAANIEDILENGIN